MTESPPNWRQRSLWHIEAWAYDFAQFLARLVPIDTVSDFGGWLFRTLGPLTSKHRIAETNLRIVFPKATEAEIADLLRAQWDELGRWIAEFPIADRIAADPDRVEVEHIERLTVLAQEHRPAVLISGHFSNFDMMAVAIMRSGVQSQITYRALNNPYMDRRIVEMRRRYGVRLFAPKGTSGARELFRAVGRGESIALLNDQKFNGGVAAPFFGRMAHTAPGPSTYALHFGIPVQPISVQRRHKARFKVVIHEPFRLADTGDRDADIETAVRRINAFMEARVLERPGEWFWVHRRWPGETYRRRKAA
ncbi:MAG TPA: lysophospholipid acyltransferase family protein [Phenylobacterium sp.]|jgi:KDO2-lipid IV(A) lauroyltransferase|uniref:lysophospholipid acyltransferase family protein n=1 Tax=Phenylobacterium sp. TaxID=1871053 RepID=UPI002D281B94|nr:lysophospholipid acyltransferase family protein [Phenylobacterium sp.]HZZ69355.1 lysophospholipid acyltransferase family protein [Phenylobacterium sp.]